MSQALASIGSSEVLEYPSRIFKFNTMFLLKKINIFLSVYFK